MCSLHMSTFRETYGSETYFSGLEPWSTRRTPGVEVEGNGGWGKVAPGTMVMWGKHESLRGDREPRGPRPPRDQPDVQGAGRRRGW